MSTGTKEQEQPQTDVAEEPRASDAAATEQALATREEAPVNRTGAMGFGLAPRNFDEGWRMASVFAKSQLVPKDYRNKPEDILVAMQHGAEVGFAPLQSLQSIAVINGRPSIWGDGMLALVKASPLCVGHDEYFEVKGERVERITANDLKDEETAAVCKFWRRGRRDPFVNSFSIGQATRAALINKRDTPWVHYPERMLMMRARSWAARDAFPDVLKGLTTVEEAQDSEPIEVTAERISESVQEPVRRSEKTAGAGTTAGAAPEPDPELLKSELPEQGRTEPVERQNGGGRATTTLAKPAAAKPAAAAAPATRKSTFPKTAPSVTTKGVLITGSAMVEPKGVAPFYEVHAQLPGKPPTAFLFFTDDEALFRQAASCEGSDTKFDVTWHGSKKHDGSPCKALEGIEAAN